MRDIRLFLGLCLTFVVVFPPDAAAYISQVDGVLVPQSTRLQACLNNQPYGELTDNAVLATVDAAVTPEAYRPVESPRGSGRYPVTFQMIGEGGGYRNVFGYYWVDEDVTNPANLHVIFDCRTGSQCDCPCNPNNMRSNDGSATSWNRTIDFSMLPGFSPGRAIGFFIRTPQKFDGTQDQDHCGGTLGADDQDHRTYFTSQALNDDGDYVHFLVWESATITDTYYFGFEDLWRGGDNDFEDSLAKVTGLVPTCVPQLETCDGADNDCDLAVDEGVTTGCTTACGSGIRQCVSGSFGACSAPSPTTELCNGLDDDCDGAVDDGVPSRACSSSCGAGTEVCRGGVYADCNAPTPTIEVCNGNDDDCDGRTDETITRSCLTACGSGTETCMAGTYRGCTAPTPGTETCNGGDDDCDGRTDENLTRGCSTTCGSGTEVCISGSYVGCTAPAPGIEACNGTDDDCDGMIDEALTRTCSTSCGTGTETCSAGSWMGCDAPTPGVEVCNNIDDDCDGVIDDGNPGGGAMCVSDGMGGYLEVDGPIGDSCVPGRVRCEAGALVCRGAASPAPEICNCEDDDCDGEIDEDSGDGLCPGDGACVACTCLTPCVDEEFPCPPGRECDRDLAVPDAGIIGYCRAGMCEGVECTDEEICDPVTGACEDLCEGVNCATGLACVRGVCVEDNCYGRGCPTGQQCRGATCVANPCAGVTCGDGEYCSEGACVPVCTVSCPQGQLCAGAMCVDAPCGGCSAGRSCVDGECVVDACEPACGRGRVCEGDTCVDDPCRLIRCPEATTCSEGQCVSDTVVPAETDPDLALATGGGGCACDTSGDPGDVPAPMIAFALLLLFGLRRRRVSGRSVRAAVSGVGLAATMAFAGGCAVDPFCLDCVEVADGGVVDMGRPDARAADGCVPNGEETCNEADDDCDGLVDEGFDTATDPRNCGACGSVCVLPGAFPGCEEGACVVDRCEIGFHDIDENGTNGCEYECLESGDELCDGRDNDCDTQVDEGIPLDTTEHCGACGNVCAYPNAGALCDGGSCAMGDCNAGFVDLDGNADNGCELACVPTGAETCNDVDDDCDGRTDEGFDLATDAANCGTCGVRCNFVNATGSCSAGVCGIGTCMPGFVDVDGLPTTGCEYACTPSGGVDDCDGIDDDCDGRIDEADPVAGTACGTSTGRCTRGTNVCQRGSIVCIGGTGALPETCDGTDEDCDGRTDENPGGTALPGTGVRCGATDTGRCAYGTVVCTGGSLTCGGGLVGPATETCNGVDDDCDGTVDDSPTGPSSTPASCAETRGVCGGRTPTCRGTSGWGCDLPATYQATETVCDGLNNDCDGSTDEGCLSASPSTDRRVDLGSATGAQNSVQVQISGDDGNRVYATWMETYGNGHVYFNRSTDSGASWGGTSVRLDDTTNGPAIGPRFAINGGGQTVNVHWADFRGGTNYREMYRDRSTDYGATFPNASGRLNPSMNIDAFNVELATSGNNVYVVYEAFTSTRSRHIFFVRSTDAGVNFSAPVQLDHGSGTSFVASTPQIAADGTDVHVVWRDNRNGALDIYHVRSTNSGSTWSTSDRRIDGGTAGSASSFDPVIAAENGNVYVAWVDDRSGSSFDIYLNRSTDRGASWGAATSIDDDPIAHDSVRPQIVTTGTSRVVVAWVDYRFGFADIIARFSDSSGAAFGSAVRLDTGTPAGTSTSFDVALAADGDLVGAAWSDDRSGFLDVHANFSLDGGRTWQPNDYRMDSGTAGSSDSERPDVYVGGGSVHVIWIDHRSGANGDVYTRRLRP
ncbi:MAG: hypothetical protein CMN30_27505 [Sandaracinus sp.]|nr:hypothetical protein [Sandaracinus sp.]